MRGLLLANAARLAIVPALLGFSGCGLAQSEADPALASLSQRLSVWGEPLAVPYQEPADGDFGTLAFASGNFAVSLGHICYLFQSTSGGWTELPPFSADRAWSMAADTVLTFNDTTGRVSLYPLSGAGAGSPIYLDPEVDTSVYHSWMGVSIAQTGDTVMLSEPRLGNVYVFERSGTTWSQSQVIPLLVYGIALDGDTAIFASDTELYAYVKQGATWVLQQQITPGPPDDFLGPNMHLSGDTALFVRDTAQRVFVRSGTTWTEQAQLNVGPILGLSSSALLGDTALIGDSGANQGFGAAYLFRRSGNVWSSAQPLTPQHASFGASVALWPGGALISALHRNVEPGHGPYGKGYLMTYERLTEPDHCDANADCASGHCVEHVCCDSACGTCQSCLASRKGFGVDGFCGPVAASAEPLDPCGVGAAAGGSGNGGDGSGGAAGTAGAWGGDPASLAASGAPDADAVAPSGGAVGETEQETAASGGAGVGAAKADDDLQPSSAGQAGSATTPDVSARAPTKGSHAGGGCQSAPGTPIGTGLTPLLLLLLAAQRHRRLDKAKTPAAPA
jgi:hypothetical protein